MVVSVCYEKSICASKCILLTLDLRVTILKIVFLCLADVEDQL